MGIANKMTTFSVAGVPVAKGRPRFSRVGNYVRTFTPKKSAAFEDRVRLCADAAGVDYLQDGPVAVHVLAYWPMRGQPRKREPRPECWKTTKPDSDNLLKGCLDAMNGVCYRDDAQVAKASVEKRHCRQDDPQGARVEITVEAITEPPWELP